MQRDDGGTASNHPRESGLAGTLPIRIAYLLSFALIVALAFVGTQPSSPRSELLFHAVALLALLGQIVFIIEPALARMRRASRDARRHHDRAKRSAEILETTGRVASIGWWSVAADGSGPHWSPEVRRIHEVGDDYTPDVAEAINFYAPEDRATIRAAVQRGFEHAESFDLELEIITRLGNRRRVRAIGIPVQSEGRVTELWGAFQDVTSRSQAMASLEQLRERFQRASEAASSGLWEYDPAAKTIWFSAHLQGLIGLDAPEPTPELADLLSRVHPDDRHRVEHALTGHRDPGAPRHAEFRVLTPDRGARWFRLRGQSSAGNANGPGLLSGSMTDIHDRHTTQSRLDLATRAASIGLWDWDVPSGRTYFNDTFYTMLGYEPGELPMTLDTWKSLVHPDDLDDALEDVRAHLEGRTPSYLNEHRLRRKDGSWTWIRDVGEIIEHEADGSPKRVIGVHVDIDAIKRLGIALESAINLPITDSLEESMHRLSAAVAQTFGVRFACVARQLEIDGVDSARVIAGWHDDHPAEPISYALEGTPCARTVSDGYCFCSDRVTELFPDDAPLQEMNAEAYAGVSLLDSRGERLGLLIIVHDAPISTTLDIESTLRLFASKAAAEIERADNERAIREAMEQARAASRAKSEFLANMSHEIRTPMTAILGYADVVMDPESCALEFTEHIETIRRNANHLLTIINDILDMSKIEAGRLGLELADVSPFDVLAQVEAIIAPRARSKGLEFTVRYSTPLPTRVVSDQTRLRQILLNLAGNAVKFTGTGSVVIDASYTPETSRLVIRVIDTGIGMDEDQRRAVERFDAFNQADSSMTRRFGGTGLGLRICNSLAQMLGGHIAIESERGTGSTFTLDIHADSAEGASLTDRASSLDRPSPSLDSIEEASRREPRGPALAGVRILLAEDGIDNQRLIRFFLEYAGATVTVVEDGQKTIETIETEPDAFDLVLMDMQMPEVDGYEATRILRAKGHSLPIIAVTAHAMTGDRDKCLVLGCSDYLSKPVDRSNLIERCAKWAAAETQQSASSPTGNTHGTTHSDGTTGNAAA